MRVLSFGAGVNSTAILVLYGLSKYDLDLVIFADTKNEYPETYNYIDKYVVPFCKEENLKFVIVSKGDLYSDYFEKRIMPFRMFRSCTDRYKIQPIRKYLKAKKYDDYVTVLGIDYGEKHRAEKYLNQSDSKIFDFPLIDMQMNRNDCKKIIKSFGWRIPVKSGCYFCPFTNKQGWINLYNKHERLFLKAEKLEKNCRKYPEFTLTQKPLEYIRKQWENQNSLCDWIDQTNMKCVYCHE